MHVWVFLIVTYDPNILYLAARKNFKNALCGFGRGWGSRYLTRPYRGGGVKLDWGYAIMTSIQAEKFSAALYGFWTGILVFAKKQWKLFQRTRNGEKISRNWFWIFLPPPIKLFFDKFSRHFRSFGTTLNFLGRSKKNCGGGFFWSTLKKKQVVRNDPK